MVEVRAWCWRNAFTYISECPMSLMGQRLQDTAHSYQSLLELENCLDLATVIKIQTLEQGEEM